MTRRSAPKASAVLVLAALVVAACGGASGPTIDDPAEILSRAVAAMQKATSVHVEATVDGSLDVDLSGTGNAASLNLAGTSLTGDVDLASGDAHVAAAVPAFLGLTADVIVLGPDTYTKVSLSGEKYQKSATAPGDPTDPAAAIKRLSDLLARPELTPVKKSDTSCGSKTCYVVEITMSAADIRALGGAALSGLLPTDALGGASLVATILVERDTLYPASASLALKGDQLGELTLRLTLRDWDRKVTIAAPPADQVE